MSDKITLTLTLDELKLIDKYVELNDETESVFDKIKDAYPQPKMTFAQSGEFTVVSYNYKLYCRFEYSNSGNVSWYKTQDVPKGYVTGVLEPVTDAETERLLEGLYYNHIEMKKEKEPVSFVPKEIKELVKESLEWCEDHPNENPLDYLTPKTPEETEQSLKEAFIEAQQTEKWKELQRKIDEEDNDKNFKNSLDLIKEWGEKNKPKTLYEICMEWWDEVFVNQMDDNICVDVLVDKINKEFIPPSSERNGYEWEKCLKIMRDKLR